MVARSRYVPIDPEARAIDVAKALLGTADTLDEHASEEERTDKLFCATLDAEVRCCESCGWWVQASEVDDLGLCEECRGGEL